MALRLAVFRAKKHCTCGSPVYELVACNECGAIYLHAEIDGNRILPPESEIEIDEFALDLEEPDSGHEELEEFELVGNDRSLVLITNRELPNCGELHVNKSTGAILEAKNEDAISITVFEKGSGGLLVP